eukprot:795244-Alexandrium_andersonii.AAC.1
MCIRDSPSTSQRRNNPQRHHGEIGETSQLRGRDSSPCESLGLLGAGGPSAGPRCFDAARDGPTRLRTHPGVEL